MGNSVTVYKLKDWYNLLDTQFNKYDRALRLIKCHDGMFQLSKSDYDKLKDELIFHNFEQFNHMCLKNTMIESWMVDKYEGKFVETSDGFIKVGVELDSKLIDLKTMKEITNVSTSTNYYELELDDLVHLLIDYDGLFSKAIDYSNSSKEELWSIIQGLVGLIDETVGVLNKYNGDDVSD